MSRATGWLGADEPDEQAPAMPTTGFILAHRGDPGQGRTLEQALARAEQAPGRADPEPEDFDARAASMLTRGYQPGAISRLAMQLQDTCTELAGEQEKLEQAARRARQVHAMHERGQIRALDIPAMLGDEGDVGRVQQLHRQADSLRRQLDAAHEAMSPPSRRDPDPLEAVNRVGHAAYVEASRAAVAAVRAGTRRPERRPFAGRGSAVRSEVTCGGCKAEGIDPDTSFLLHSDPDRHPGLDAEIDFVPDVPEQAERRHGGYAEIAR